MLVLGIHGDPRQRDFEGGIPNYSSHDGAAVLLRNGEVVAAVEEERLNRIKHSNFFPARAIRYCLAEAGATLEDVDLIAVDSFELHAQLNALRLFLAESGRRETTARDYIGAAFEDEFGVDVAAKIRFCKHHWAHLAGAFYASGFERSLVVCLDGDDAFSTSGLIAVGSAEGLQVLKEFSFEQSLGHFYEILIALTGYRRFDEYKVMGLAPHGRAGTYTSFFDALYELLPGGDYALATEEAFVQEALERGLLTAARRKGEPFEQGHKDLAAGLQAALEAIVLHVVSHFREQTEERNLCLSGGVAHNCSMNGTLLYSGLFERVFAHPLAHDAGNAHGAALWAYGTEAPEGPAPAPLEHLFWGPDLIRIEEQLEPWGELISFRRSPDIARETARLLADGKVVGWVQGRSEFGPRALGNRSILADPRPAGNKNIVNRMVKKREAYRPFAPAVKEERAADYFETVEGAPLAYMTLVLKVREEARQTLGAVTHVDGTARVQSVSERTNPVFWNLLDAFEENTGLPVLLNTSFNNNAEPIVDSIDDAVTCYLTTGLDRLVVGDFLVEKRHAPLDPGMVAELAPSLPASRKLTRCSTPDGAVYRLEATFSEFFGENQVEISKDVFDLLLGSEEGGTVAEAGTNPALLAEIFDLWCRRILVLRPC